MNVQVGSDVDMTEKRHMSVGFCLLITNVQVGSDVGMTIVHLNLSYLLGWIVATNQKGEDAKTFWT